MDEELYRLINEKNDLLQRIDAVIDGPYNGVDNQRARLRRGLAIFEFCVSLVEKSYDKKPEEKMYYFNTLLNALAAMYEVYDNVETKEYPSSVFPESLDEEFIKQICEATKKQLSEIIHPIETIEFDKDCRVYKLRADSSSDEISKLVNEIESEYTCWREGYESIIPIKIVK